MPKLGDVKIRRVFLYFPCSMLGKWKWWEYANIVCVYWYSEDYEYYPSNHWRDICWEEDLTDELIKKYRI